jgi:hypothetical protein
MDHRVRYGFVVVLVGLGVLALIYVVAIRSWESAADVASVLSAVGGVIGTIIGAFFGVQVGSAGKEKADDDRRTAEQQRKRAEDKYAAVLALMSPNDFQGLERARPDLFGPSQKTP